MSLKTSEGCSRNVGLRIPPFRRTPPTFNGTPKTGQQSVATLQALLTKAQATYDSLMNGAAVASFMDSNGERVQYTQANRPDLFNYIQTLIGQINSQVIACQSGTGPLRYYF